MLRFCLSGLLVLLAMTLFCQSDYQPGYLIKASGERLAVDILDRDWATSPETFKYRTTDGSTQIGDVGTVREFGIGESEVRYVRAGVDIEDSPRELNSLSKSPLPEYRRDTVFLEVLLDGAADLFYYKSGNRLLFFYRMGEGAIKPLVSRRYLSGDRMVHQDLYRDVLFSLMACGVSTPGKKLDYARKPLMRYVENYNACVGAEYVIYERRNQGRRFRLALRGGVDHHRSSMGYISSSGRVDTYDYDDVLVPRVGIEAELTFRFLHAQWAVTGEAYYQRFRLDWVAEPIGRELDLDVTSINVPVGVRYYFSQGTKTDVYANLFGQFLFPVDGDAYYASGLKQQVFVSMAPGAGAGVRFADHLQLELRYNLAQDMLRSNTALQHRQRTISLVGGYQF
ncbi:hypothetical protein [Lewinella sp. IMCC34191]|uniref:hypothetical protein n=1 Tax=Lewinella sp. IMCC34191 TaxID=2259172 RepID=UPI00130095DC|nr:hypothetical protein [Lewinella sp. IMCC34191]